MSSLVELYLYDNSLSGPIPPSYSELSQLRYLHAFSNRLTLDPFPHDLCASPELQSLYVHTTDVGNCDEYLFVQNTAMCDLAALVSTHDPEGSGWRCSVDSGNYSYPSNLDGVCSWAGVICNTSHVNVVSIRANSSNSTTGGYVFSGQLPDLVGSMLSLQTFELYNNYLVGTLPSAWANMSSLRNLSLYGNSMDREFDDDAFCDMASLMYFYLTQSVVHECTLITDSPSSVPSIASVDPTVTPTAALSISPSISGAAPASTVVQFNITEMVVGMDTIDSAAIDAFVEITSSKLGIAANNVVVHSVTSVDLSNASSANTQGRMLRSADSILRRGRVENGDVHGNIILFGIAATLEDFDQTSPVELVDSLSAVLLAAYSDPTTVDEWVELSVSLGSSTVTTDTVVYFEEPVVSERIVVVIVETSYPSMSPTMSDSEAPLTNGGNDDTAIPSVYWLVGAVGVLGLVIMLGGMWWYNINKRKQEENENNFNSVPQEDVKKDDTATVLTAGGGPEKLQGDHGAVVIYEPIYDTNFPPSSTGHIVEASIVLGSGSFSDNDDDSTPDTSDGRFINEREVPGSTSYGHSGPPMSLEMVSLENGEML